MNNPRYTEEFKIQTVNQVTGKKLLVADVAARLGVSTHGLYTGQSAIANLKKNGSRMVINTMNCVVCERNSSA